MMSPKKILKIGFGVIIFFTLPSILLFTYIYFKYNEELPKTTPSAQADVVAYHMMQALNYEAYKNTDYLEWTFNKRHHYKWHKAQNLCEVYWKNIQVHLNLNNTKTSKVFIYDEELVDDSKFKYITQAVDYFNNDSFWLVGPFKAFDKGTTRSLVPQKSNKEGLLVRYTSGGSTPGDSYLWLLDSNYKPYAFKMWVSILPIDGLQASWNDWTTTEAGFQLPTFHKLMFMGLEISDIKTGP